MGARSLLVALCTFCCSQFVAGSEGLGSHISLVQSLVRVHGTEEEIGEELPDDPIAVDGVTGWFTLTNDNLKHKGPGVIYRRTPKLDDIVLGRDNYIPFGHDFMGKVVGEGFVEVVEPTLVEDQRYFLPVHIHGQQVVIAKNVTFDPRWEDGIPPTTPPPAAQPTARPMRRRTTVGRFHYAPTEFQTQPDVWIPCKILRAGSRNNTYTIRVMPKSFMDYNVSDVPASSLKKVQRIREYIPLKPLPQFADSTNLVRKDMESVFHVSVQNVNTNELMELKMFRKSPVRTFMKMACERAHIPWFKCDKSVRFMWGDVRLSQEDLSYQIGMKDGELVRMFP